MAGRLMDAHQDGGETQGGPEHHQWTGDGPVNGLPMVKAGDS